MKGKLRDFLWVVIIGSMFMPWYIRVGWGFWSWNNVYEGFGHAYLRVIVSFILILILNIIKDIPKGIKSGISVVALLFPISLIQFAHYAGAPSIGAYLYILCALLLIGSSFLED